MPTTPIQEPCPLCEEQSLRKRKPVDGTDVHFDCEMCGRFALSNEAWYLITLGDGVRKATKRFLSHIVCRGQPTLDNNNNFFPNSNYPSFSIKDIENINTNSSLPTVQQQIEYLLLYIYESTKVPGEPVNITRAPCQAAIGAQGTVEISFALAALEEKEFIRLFPPNNDDFDFVNKTLPAKLIAGTSPVVYLTTAGFAEVASIQKGDITSQTAFMAMQYGEPETDKLFYNHIKPAVEQTGFEIRRLDENKRTGLIDNKMHTDIRTSAFLVADLTHNNRGAYWEAGFAEGIGKKVIYLCKDTVFSSKESAAKPHFDTNHHLTIQWSENNPEPAMEELKATIRASLPEKAKLHDS